jgi:branched-chain amino acid transport system substrate-binding protein
MTRYDFVFCVFLVLCGSRPAWGASEAVKIGVLTDETGPYADDGGLGSVEAARMAIEDFGGKALGLPIELVSADHRDMPEVGVEIARQWLDRDGVDLIADLTDSSVALAVRALTRDRGKIDIVTGGATSRLTGADCSPTGFHWVYDTYALGRVAGGAAVDQGDKTWFFITTERPFATALEKNATGFITANGGKVLGAARHPPNIADFSPYLLQAQASGAQIIAVADAGADAVAIIRQATRFGIGRGGQRISGLLMTLSEINTLGIDLAQGMVIATAAYWDQSPESRLWSRRFLARANHMPNMIQAGTYSAVTHYLKAVEAAGTKDGPAVAGKMREIAVNDVFFNNGLVRTDGLMQHDMLLAEVKSPSDSAGPWDYLTILATIPGDIAFQPLAKSSCPLVKN